MRPILILRPEPGAGRTAALASAMELKPVTAPLFRVRALAWRAPDAGRFDAVLMTSANAARLGGGGLRAFTHLPCYAVGEATAAAAAEAGFGDIRAGPSDGMSAVAGAARDGRTRLFHPAGRNRKRIEHPGIRLETAAVYASDPAPALPPAAGMAIERRAVVLVHSPRAGALLDALTEQAGVPRHDAIIAAISAAAADAAGKGWAGVHAASLPRDEALLELVAKLCQIGGA